MRPRTKASLLWGAVSALVFLVLVQSYELLFALRISLLVKFAIAVVVAVVAAGVNYMVGKWLTRSERS